MLLLGITGAKGSGKGTVAEYVREWAAERGLLAVDRGFADKLKWAMARLFWPEISREEAIVWANAFKNAPEGGMTRVAIECKMTPEGPILRGAEISGRQLFQHGGTEMGRELFGNNFWVDQLLPLGEDLYFPSWDAWHSNFCEDRNEKTKYRADIGTISDLRFENEALRIMDLGGEIWKVDRQGYEPDGHASEVPMPRAFVDLDIPNDGDLLELKQEVFDRCDSAQARGMIPVH